MSRFDKYEPMGGGFRAPYAIAMAQADLSKAWGVGLDVNGRIVKGAGNSGILGVVCTTSAKAIGSIGDVMTDGEVVEVPGLTAGTAIFAIPATGELTTVAAGNTRVGHTVEAGRLVVRAAR